MKVPAPVQQLLEKEMDRKDFLKQMAAATLMVAGGGVIMKTLSDALQPKSKATQTASLQGYGASVYGGVKSA